MTRSPPVPALREDCAMSDERKDVYTVVEYESQGEQKSFWMRVGAGFVNRDGSINVFLDAFPVNGKLQIRDHKPREEQNYDSQENPATDQADENQDNGDYPDGW